MSVYIYIYHNPILYLKKSIYEKKLPVATENFKTTEKWQ